MPRYSTEWRHVSQSLAPHPLLEQHSAVKPVIVAWSRDPDMWIRRAALLSHLKHKDKTDERQLFAHCVQLSGEKEFFIRKAIGWGAARLQQDSAGRAAAFLHAHRASQSPLTLREASKHRPAAAPASQT